MTQNKEQTTIKEKPKTYLYILESSHRKNLLESTEEAYRRGLRDAYGTKDIGPLLLTSQVKAVEIAAKYLIKIK